MATPSQDLRHRAGLLFKRGFRGLTVGPDDAVVTDLRARGLGSVVLFDVDGPSGGAQPRNVQSPEQVRGLCESLRTAVPAGDPPPLISIDQEGGLVQRLKGKYGFPDVASARDTGASGDPAVTGAAAAELADILAGAGVNMNLAPVVDLDVWRDNPIIGGKARSYAQDPEEVAAHAAAFVRAHHARGVLTCLKHFPGHGSARTDTHLSFTDVSDTWTEDELIPYRRLLADGLVDAVMTAHVFNRHLDADGPATLSKATIDGLLRGELGYEGVVVSDDMGMRAIADNFGFEEAVARCLGAGVDVLALANQNTYEDDITERTADLIVRLVAEGRLSEARVDEAAERVLALRRRLADMEG